MATATVADVRTAHPEFTEALYDDAAVTAAISVAAALFSFDTDAICDLSAHLLSIASEDNRAADNGAGVVTSEEIGDRIVQYKTVAETGDEAWYARTAYGRLFLQRRRASAVNFPRVF